MPKEQQTPTATIVFLYSGKAPYTLKNDIFAELCNSGS